MKKLILTEHAEDALVERELDLDWIERAVRDPSWTVPDPGAPVSSAAFAPFLSLADASCGSPHMKRRVKSV
jgi:hypothetical protein